MILRVEKKLLLNGDGHSDDDGKGKTITRSGYQAFGKVNSISKFKFKKQ